MNYELAKKLKDAGFPQEGKGVWQHGYRKEGEKYIVESLYIPTLSELIENIKGCFSLYNGNKRWEAGFFLYRILRAFLLEI